MTWGSSLVVASFVVSSIGGSARAEPQTSPAARVREIGDEPTLRSQLDGVETAELASGPPTLGNIHRIDVLVGGAGIARALLDAGVHREALDALDAVFLTRIDLFSVATKGRAVSLWLDDAGGLLGALVDVGRSSIMAARYDGELASHGFYDARGFSMSGPLRVRPVLLSRVTSRFGERFDPISGSSAVHHGVDYAVPVGTAVFAAGTGRVKARGTSESAGNYLKLSHAGGFESWYLHLARFEPGTEVGALVTQGMTIAWSGNTGRSTGPHVHYELHLAGEALDSQLTMPIPDKALGPLALRQHRAFIQELQQLRGDQAEAQQGDVIR